MSNNLKKATKSRQVTPESVRTVNRSERPLEPAQFDEADSFQASRKTLQWQSWSTFLSRVFFLNSDACDRFSIRRWKSQSLTSNVSTFYTISRGHLQQLFPCQFSRPETLEWRQFAKKSFPPLFAGWFLVLTGAFVWSFLSTTREFSKRTRESAFIVSTDCCIKEVNQDKQ